MTDTPASPTGDGHAAATEAVAAMASLTQRNVRAMLAAAQGMVRACETAAHELTAFSTASADRARDAARAMTSTTSPQQLFDVQADFWRAQVAANLAQLAALSDAVVSAQRDALVPRSAD